MTPNTYQGFVMLMRPYKGRRRGSYPETRALHRPATAPAMAPCFSYTAVHHSGFPGKDNLRLRKPRVEKMRRDRINTCIEQLKSLLEKELHRQEPNAKLEKADVLEMTVSYLRQRLLLPPAPGGPGEPSHREPSLQGFAQGHRDLLSSVGPGRETSVCAAPSPPPPSLLVLRHQEHQGGLLLAQRDFTSSSSSSSSSSSIVSSSHRPTGSKSLVYLLAPQHQASGPDLRAGAPVCCRGPTGVGQRMGKDESEYTE
ncbi:Transcription factor HES-5 [Merluccius polli]|uniref:Transcription factor HES-5 n=1 Tax=Merluccius polli TaxID=89951 RepID=A0AA47MWS0_MERPO|nr:Transcription factor HES-5 [Merluccius polli]